MNLNLGEEYMLHKEVCTNLFARLTNVFKVFLADVIIHISAFKAMVISAFMKFPLKVIICRSLAAFLPLVQQAAMGFNQSCPPGRTVVMVVDFSKAFDAVDHVVLLSCLLDNTMGSNSIRWICAYLRGRTASCSYNRKESHGVHVQQGVPQG